MNAKEISEQIDSWLEVEDLPAKAGLKRIRRFDDLYPSDEDERQAYWDFIKWSRQQEHLPLLVIRKNPGEKDFWEEW